jgi:endonuclease III
MSLSTLQTPGRKEISKAQEFYKILISVYGIPVWRDPLPAIDELVSTILSQNTNDVNRDRAFDNLRANFPTWKSVMLAEPDEIISAIRVAGLANQKGPRIQSVLNQIHMERGELSLDFLRVMEKEKARKWLMKQKGVGPKTAAIVLQFSLGIPAFPVDTHVYRVTGRVGIRPQQLNVERTHVWMERLFKPQQFGPGHLNIIHLGREICHARKPECTICPLIHLCDYFLDLKEMKPTANI